MPCIGKVIRRATSQKTCLVVFRVMPSGEKSYRTHLLESNSQLNFPFMFILPNRTLVGCALLWCLSISMTAQQINLNDSLETEVIISHSRVAIAKKESIKPTYLLTKKDIEANGSLDLPQLLTKIPGVIVNGAFSNPSLNQSVYLQGATGAYTLVLLDGVPVIDPSGIGGVVDLRNFSTAEIESIEIIKGGQSTLYGSDAVAGVVNIITNKKSKKHTASIDLGSLGYFRSGITSAENIDRFHYQTTVAFERATGQSEAKILTDGGDTDGFDRIVAALSTSYQWSEHWNINSFVRYNKFDGDYDGGAYTDALNTYESQWLQFGGKIDYSKEEFKGQLQYTQSQFNRDFEDVVFGASLLGGKMNNLDAIGHIHFLDNKLLFSGGLNYQKFIDNVSASSVSADIISPYVNILSRRENLIIETGLRLNHHSTFGQNTNYSMGVNYRWKDTWKAYFSHASSFKAPNLFQLYGPFGGNSTLSPELGFNTQFGVQADFPSIYLSLNYFNRRLRQVIFYDFADGFRNQDQLNMQGLELSLSKSFKNFKGNASYMRILSQESSEVLRVPQNLITGSISWERPRAVNLVLQANYMGSRMDAFFNNQSLMLNEVVLAPLLLFHLTITTQTDKLPFKLNLNIINLFNRTFEEPVGFNGLGRNIRFGLLYSIK